MPSRHSASFHSGPIFSPEAVRGTRWASLVGFRSRIPNLETGPSRQTSSAPLPGPNLTIPKPKKSH